MQVTWLERLNYSHGSTFFSDSALFIGFQNPLYYKLKLPRSKYTKFVIKEKFKLEWHQTQRTIQSELSGWNKTLDVKQKYLMN